MLVETRPLYQKRTWALMTTQCLNGRTIDGLAKIGCRSLGFIEFKVLNVQTTDFKWLSEGVTNLLQQFAMSCTTCWSVVHYCWKKAIT